MDVTSTDSSARLDEPVSPTEPPANPDDHNEGHNHDMNDACSSGCPQHEPPVG